MDLVISETCPIHFDNSYARLPERFHVRLRATPVPEPRLVKVNARLADELSIDAGFLASPDGIAILSGNVVPPGADPIATAYAGHQFGSFVPQLGDGRAILLGEVIGRDGMRWDIQLKGAGPTPFSRRGDGRAALGSVLREYVVSEAMAALGIPTTRALAAVTTGATVWRDVPLPGAILTRVAASHIRIGTFQYFAARGDADAVRRLADYVIARHYLAAANVERPYRALLELVVARQAELMARWLLVGFIHGVMNTDNMSIAGETIDYGPCAFMDTYHPAAVYSSIDEMGRYAFANQPAIARWNLARLAEALLPLLGKDHEAAVASAEEALKGFTLRFNAAYGAGLGRKLGFLDAQDGDFDIARDLLQRMAANTADFTRTFRFLVDAAQDVAGDIALRAEFANPSALDEWLPRWRARLAKEGDSGDKRRALMCANNPAFIPRNHRVEEAIAAAVDRSDFAPFETLLHVLSAPYEDRPDLEQYAAAPRPEEVVHQTFCGT